MKPNDIFLLVALAFIIGMMYFNGRKRKKQQADMQAGVKVGAYVLLHSGILGTIVSLDEKNAVVETTPGTQLTIVKGAVRSVEEAPKKAATPKAATKPAAKSTTAAKPAAKPAAKKPAAKKPAAKTAK